MSQNRFKWPLINDNISKNDKRVLADFILASNRFTNGPKVQEFERIWSEWLGVEHSVMVSSGASANYITTSIVRELKGSSGEIIVPTIGWVSDVSAVINNGFVPVFVDVELSTMAIAYENVKMAINENTKAIVLVHALGFTGINDALIELAAENNLLLIEDCCEAHGATYRDKKVGSLGDMSCFSFYFGHHITTIEGGMISTNDDEIYQLARMFRSHGLTREASADTQNQYKSPNLNPLFTFAVAGYNMRSTELNAVLGIEQIKRLNANIDARRNNLNIWLSALNSERFFVDFQCEGNSNFALPLLIRSPSVSMERVCKLLEEEHVEFRVGTAGGGNQVRQPFLRKHHFRVAGSLDNSDYIHHNGLYVGNHPEIEKEQIINLCRSLNNV